MAVDHGDIGMEAPVPMMHLTPSPRWWYSVVLDAQHPVTPQQLDMGMAPAQAQASDPPPVGYATTS